MGSIRQTTLILGEGITEFFFLNSLKDDYRELKSVKPDYPKNTNLEEIGIIAQEQSSHIQSEGLNMQREFNDGENNETSDCFVVGDSVGNTCLCGVA